MNTIRLLPDELINKIKAGEMIERPANVLKELVENAIDAGAPRITIALEKGGIDEIVVSDNGSGIEPDDVPLAIKRHATSKISQTDDLWALHSLGFRGEALASIAEVSHFTLITRSTRDASLPLASSPRSTRDASLPLASSPRSTRSDQARAGARLTVDSSGKVDIVPWNCAVGTSITVKDIFYNVPARRKFLKNAATEYSHCQACVQALALSHPQVEFILHHNSKEQLRVVATPQAKGEEALRLRAAALFGKETVEALLYAEDKNEMAEVAMLFSPPGQDRGHSRHIFTFVNDRWIKSSTLKYGILRGYHSHLLKGRYPLVLMYLRVHPSLLDVNVHPMKNEVRFQYDKDVQELIAVSLRRQLRSPAWSTAPATLAASTPMPASPAPPELPSLAAPVRTSTAARASAAAEKREQRIFYPQAEAKPAVPELPWRKNSDREEIASADKPHESRAAELDWQALTYLGTVARCYLLFEDRQQNFIVVDQHAFHERIIFEQLQADPQKLTRGQSLTIAEALSLSAAEVETIKTRHTEFARLGFTLEVAGTNDVLLKGVPALLHDKDYGAALQELLALAQRDATAWFGESLLHDVVATIACRAAIKAGDLLERERLQQLFVAARDVDFYHNCPHGRRVIRSFTPRQVGNWFDRI